LPHKSPTCPIKLPFQSGEIYLTIVWFRNIANLVANLEGIKAIATRRTISIADRILMNFPLAGSTTTLSKKMAEGVILW